MFSALSAADQSPNKMTRVADFTLCCTDSPTCCYIPPRKSNTNQRKIHSLLKNKFDGLGTGSNPDLHQTHQDFRSEDLGSESQPDKLATTATARLGKMSPANSSVQVRRDSRRTAAVFAQILCLEMIREDLQRRPKAGSCIKRGTN